jgi:hypothetical protein
VKSSAIPSLEGLDRLAFREGIDIRPTLVRVLTDLYVQKPTHSAEEERHYTELVLRLIEVVDISTRAIVARKLATYGAAPEAIVRRLARDVLEVAEPVLKHSQRLSGAELLAIIQDLGPRYAEVIGARRPPAPVFATSVHNPPVPGVSAGPGPDQARTAGRVTTAGIADLATGERPQIVGERAAKPAADIRLGELFLAAGRTERRAILTNLDEEDAAEPAGPAGRQPDEACARLEKAALQRKPEEFIRELQGALGIAPVDARRIVEDAAGEPLLVAAKALGMLPEMLLRILLFLNPVIGQSVPRVFDLAKLYDQLTTQAASHIVASLRETASTVRRAGHQPLLWDDEADRGRRAAADAARRPAGQPPAHRRAAPAIPARRQGTT